MVRRRHLSIIKSFTFTVKIIRLRYVVVTVVGQTVKNTLYREETRSYKVCFTSNETQQCSMSYISDGIMDSRYVRIRVVNPVVKCNLEVRLT